MKTQQWAKPHTVNDMTMISIKMHDATGCTRVYLVKSKQEVLSIFKNFHKMVENQFDREIKVLRSDNGGEYISHEFKSFPSENEIECQSSCAYTPELN